MRKYKIIINLYRIISIILLAFLVFMYTEYKNKDCIETYEVVNPNYVFLGDSITALYDLEKYYEGYKVVNSGISGQTTQDILEDLKYRVDKYNPTKVIILIGVNDIQKGFEIDETVGNIRKIIQNIKSNNKYCDIYLQSIYPINNTDNDKINKDMVGIRTNEQIIKINEELKKVAKEEKIQYVNLHDKLLDEKGNLKLDYTKEGLHISDKGYEIITDYIKENILND